MWQLLLGAAVAGSTSYLAKHLFNPSGQNNPFSNQTTPIPNNDQGNEQSNSVDEVKFPPFLGQSNSTESGSEISFQNQTQDGIFRFSSSESVPKKTRFPLGKRNLGKKVAKKSEIRSRGVVVCKRRSAVCLKRMKIAKTADYKCVSCSSRDNPALGCGVGIGIMYMMSAGKAEISKMNSMIDETAKVVQGLKSELCKRKSSHDPVASDPSNLVAMSLEEVTEVPVIDNGEYASSVLTEEPQQEQEDLEMTQLEAELEAELQKLSESDVSAERMNESGEERTDVYENCGVLPSELNQKLCHVLIEQQGSQIMELESELHLAQRKLNEKEAELQALKDCVKRLTALNLSTVSDDEGEVEEDGECGKGEVEIRIGSMKPSVGMKRPIEA